MTLIVGILCEDGVVMGADGAATLGNIQSYTVRQPIKKLTIQPGNIIMGTSGPVGLGQRFQWEIQHMMKEESGSLLYRRTGGGNKEPKAPQEVMEAISDKKFRKHIKKEFEAAEAPSKVIGSKALASAMSQTMLAIPLVEKAYLFQFDHQGAPEMATKDLPFISIGSGQPTADPFLAFLRRVFWKDHLPSLAEGRLAATWTLSHAIKTTPGGISDPIQIAVLENGGSEWKATFLPDEELQEHQQNIERAEEALRTYFTEKKEVTPPPKP